MELKKQQLEADKKTQDETLMLTQQNMLILNLIQEKKEYKVTSV